MAQDKKVRHGRLRMVLPRRVGDCVVREIEAAQVLKGLQAWKERLS
jgi:3-dehydroquinate synthetase